MRRKAFTLVELLVVIGIIAILVAVLLPALMSTRKQAEALKCAAALREIGTCIRYYIDDNRGYMIPARVSNNYRLNGITYGAASTVANVSTTTPAYWPSFLEKYVTKARMGNAATSNEEAADAQKTVLWGCPAFGKYIATTAFGGFSNLQNGYGINYTPTYTASDPAPGGNYPNGYSSPQPGLNSVLASSNNWADSVPTTGTWFKASRYTNPSQRAIIADAQFWIVEALAPPATGVIPPQKLYNNTNTYSDGVSGQTLYDFYRHGKYPPVAVPGGGGYYSASGGKVLYNILYCDGHVTGTSDRAEGYRAIRQRFPQ